VKQEFATAHDGAERRRIERRFYETTDMYCAMFWMESEYVRCRYFLLFRLYCPRKVLLCGPAHTNPLEDAKTSKLPRRDTSATEPGRGIVGLRLSGFPSDVLVQLAEIQKIVVTYFWNAQSHSIAKSGCGPCTTTATIVDLES
jgi:hypothetical protein